MKKKLVLVFFIIATAILVLGILAKNEFGVAGKVLQSATLVSSGNTAGNGAGASADTGEGADSLSMPLNDNETPFSSLLIDFTGDGYEDYVAAVTVSDTKNLSLVVCVYNNASKLYERAAEIKTEITPSRTFSCTSIELSGRHNPALLYQGVTDDGDSLLRAYLLEPSEPDVYVPLSVKLVADLKSDGTIYVQHESGADEEPVTSFMVYSSVSESGKSAEQVSTKWQWSEKSGRFVAGAQTKIQGGNLIANELGNLQNLTVPVFAAYLDGLWYKAENKSNVVRYIFFDSESKQIIFLRGDEEEVYNWDTSTLHYRGIDIFTTNFEITNLQRNVSINLVDSEAIRVAAHDDVSMVITEENVWNGTYKKLKFSDYYAQTEKDDMRSPAYIENLEQGAGWRASDGTMVSFSGGRYSVKEPSGMESGEYVPLQVRGQTFIQFRCLQQVGAEAFLSGVFLVSSAKTIDDSSSTDDNRVLFQPYVLNLDDAYPSDKRAVLLTRMEEKK